MKINQLNKWNQVLQIVKSNKETSNEKLIEGIIKILEEKSQENLNELLIDLPSELKEQFSICKEKNEGLNGLLSNKLS